MKLRVRSLGLLCMLCAAALNCLSLDREAFTVTNYNLTLRLEPEQQRLGVRGRITLRNDSPTTQKIAVLQISSSLDWRSIQSDGKPLQFVSQPYTSDIDHTGALSEALVTLPQAVTPKGSVDLDVAYEGVIVLDTTRLTRIGAPEVEARSTDWDQISPKFTAVRGIGYVAWYPIATDSVDLADSTTVSETVGRWKQRHSEAEMLLTFESTKKLPILCSGTPAGFVIQTDEDLKIAAFSMIGLGINVPTFTMADYKALDAKDIHTMHLPGSEETASTYTDLLAGLDLSPLHGSPRMEVAQLPDSDAVPFVTDRLLLTPMSSPLTESRRLMLVYALARQEVRSPRPWIVEGLAHLAQVTDIEHRRGRQAGLDYLSAHRTSLANYEREIPSGESSAQARSSGTSRSLINTPDEAYLQSKALWVWCMIRDMIGDTELSVVLFSYSISSDNGHSYMQTLLEKPANRNLQWFFDDWVYRDRGLPDFKIESAFSRKTLGDAYIVTVTVDNLGEAGAEVPVMLKFTGGEVAKRLEIRGKNKNVVRFEVPNAPQEVIVNDGSVPESDLTNNTFKIEAADASK